MTEKDLSEKVDESPFLITLSLIHLHMSILLSLLDFYIDSQKYTHYIIIFCVSRSHARQRGTLPPKTNVSTLMTIPYIIEQLCMKSIHKSEQFIYRLAINVFLKQVYSITVHVRLQTS